jgi:hypothetical protein
MTSRVRAVAASLSRASIRRTSASGQSCVITLSKNTSASRTGCASKKSCPARSPSARQRPVHPRRTRTPAHPGTRRGPRLRPWSTVSATRRRPSRIPARGPARQISGAGRHARGELYGSRSRRRRRRRARRRGAPPNRSLVRSSLSAVQMCKYRIDAGGGRNREGMCEGVSYYSPSIIPFSPSQRALPRIAAPNRRNLEHAEAVACAAGPPCALFDAFSSASVWRSAAASSHAKYGSAVANASENAVGAGLSSPSLSSSSPSPFFTLPLG